MSNFSWTCPAEAVLAQTVRAIRVEEDLLRRANNAIRHLAGSPLFLTQQAFMEMAIENLTKKPLKVERQLPEGLTGIPLVAANEHRPSERPARPARRQPRSQRGGNAQGAGQHGGRPHGKPFGHRGGAKKKRPFAGKR